jgi:hypothetical protein
MCEPVGCQFGKHAPLAALKIIITIGGTEMLSRDCDGCSQMKACSRRYFVVEKGNCVFCPDGTAHLVDGL